MKKYTDEAFELLKVVYDKMMDEAIKAHDNYVRSNHKINQLSAAKIILKEKINNYGDIGMGYVVTQLDELLKCERGINERLRTDYYSYDYRLNEIKRIVKDETGECIGDIDEEINKRVIFATSDEFKKAEQEAFEKYCK